MNDLISNIKVYLISKRLHSSRITIFNNLQLMTIMINIYNLALSL